MERGHGSEGIFPRDRCRRARPISLVHFQSQLGLGFDQPFAQAHHRHDQRLLLRRRVHSSLRLRHRGHSRGCSIRPLGGQLGHHSRGEREQGDRGYHALSPGALLRHDRQALRRAAGGGDGARQHRRSREPAQGRNRQAGARVDDQEPDRACIRKASVAGGAHHGPGSVLRVPARQDPCLARGR